MKSTSSVVIVKVLNDEQGIRYFLRQQVSVCEGTNLMNLT